jgi:hypothetical protein
MKEETIDTRIEQAALSGDGYLVVRFENEKRKAEAQEFAGRCKEIQDRLDEIQIRTRAHTERTSSIFSTA